MHIGGWQKLTLKDYPSKVASIIFTNGCCFRCGFCYNPEIVVPPFELTVEEEEIMSYLKKRKGMVEGVVITGGEPMIHDDLFDFIKKIRGLGYAIKLDTNGLMSEKLKQAVGEGLLDYIAMDIKAPIEKYEEVVRVAVDTEKIKQSIDIILKSGIDYEFRSTIVKELHTKDDIINMAKLINGAERYYLQKFLPAPKLLVPSFKDKTSYAEDELKAIAVECLKYVELCEVR